MAQFHTTAAYVSGGICGSIWWPMGAVCGKIMRHNLRGPWGIFQEGDGWSWRDALNSLLMRDGGDFQNAQFTSDTVVRIERRRVDGPGRYTLHVFEREIGQLKDCTDLVDADHYVGDFMGDE